MKRNLPAWLVPLTAVLIFCLAGLALIPFPGLQNDELFFSGPIYSQGAAFYNIQIGAWKIPAMVMSYTGALKTWIYAALFEFLAPTEWSVRIPVLLMGMATIWLTWAWVRRIAGTRAAAVTAILLATDTVFLMTNTFDWGPVGLQHILLMGGLIAVQSWLAGNSRFMLALGFFLWGLGMWDKALLSWPLIGLAAGAICVYPRETARRLRPMPLAVAAASFLIGAAPLVWYNIDRHGETASANAKFTAEGIAGKVGVLRATVDGSTLFGYMVYTNPAPGARPPRTAIGRISARISSFAGNHKTNRMIPAYALGLVCFVFLRRSPRWRTMAFLLIVCAVAWAQMAFTKGTGGASHHVILLWPFPVLFLGIAFTEAAARSPRFGMPVLAVLVTFLTAENLLTTNEYLTEFAVNGGSGGWTDAIYRLADSVEKSPSVGWYGLVDWGYLNALQMLHEGDLPVFIAAIPPAGATPTDADRAEIRREIDAPDRVFIQHTEDKQMFPGINDRLRGIAAELGFEERVERVVHDRNGRPVFELVRFVKTP
jgi:4-amino-4-deoxy-L-arabinose transferase-like glycosyltransferase